MGYRLKVRIFGDDEEFNSVELMSASGQLALFSPVAVEDRDGSLRVMLIHDEERIEAAHYPEGEWQSWRRIYGNEGR